MRPALRAEHGLLIGYLGGVAGTTWDWHEHYVGVSNQAPHLLIDLSALLVVGVVVVAAASVWDLYWHQTHPMELGASMNMMTLPPHQLILAGFIAGLIASAGVLVAKSRLPEPATTRA